MFHLGNELPEITPCILDHESPNLTKGEFKILKDQVRSNSVLINEFVSRLDLFVNKEKYPSQAVFIQKIRRRLELLMEENDTFRKVLWKHCQTEDLVEVSKIRG